MRESILIGVLYLLNAATSHGHVAQANPPRILRADPADFSLIRDFRADWCGAALCYGTAQFALGGRVRALLARAGSGLYVESEPAAVDLLKPRFSVVGPVNGTGPGEVGEASLRYDAKGEVEAAQLSAPALGTLRAHR